jgi:hypothetical protein
VNRDYRSFIFRVASPGGRRRRRKEEGGNTKKERIIFGPGVLKD